MVLTNFSLSDINILNEPIVANGHYVLSFLLHNVEMTPWCCPFVCELSSFGHIQASIVICIVAEYILICRNGFFGADLDFENVVTFGKGIVFDTLNAAADI